MYRYHTAKINKMFDDFLITLIIEAPPESQVPIGQGTGNSRNAHKTKYAMRSERQFLAIHK